MAINSVKMNIFVNFETKDVPTNSEKIIDLVYEIVKNEKKEIQSLTVIIVSNPKILEINKNYLNHDYFTDVIAFNLEEKGEPIEAEIYVSNDEAKIQAENFGATHEHELLRYIAHGTLHTLGYEDFNFDLKQEMHEKENFYLNRIFFDSTN
ncbi:MAG: rRNA maturation RNase YbeY [Calditrichaeota bacterium]|nr:MAG: rRNA maturation RNase YbeY [Calditrichota bacterium]